ncbi:MAG: chloride channel protein, partial [Thermoanaerobaculia bacterium]
VIIAAAVAAAIERSVLGEDPVFNVTHNYSLEHTSSLFLYAILGILAAVVSIVFTDLLLNMRGRFREMKRIPEWARPAIGGFVTGLLAVVALLSVSSAGILGGGYETLATALGGSLGVKALLVLCALKVIATVFSYASGGAGGIFAPALFIGGMLGGAVGHLDQAVFGSSSEQIGAFALVGMGAVFAGIIRAPITSVLIIFEMTDGYSLILPLMIANMTAFGLARKWRPVPIYQALLQQDGIHIQHRTPAIGSMPVATAMLTKPATIPAEATIDQALASVADYDYTTFPVVSSSGQFAGFVNRMRLLAQRESGGGSRPVVEAITRAEFVLPNETLQKAAIRLHEIGAHVIAVVDSAVSRRFLGILTSGDIVRAQAQSAPVDPDDQTASRRPQRTD